ncbi:MAG: hypothetical protein PHE15_07400 [Dehalococcoidales bacterium]|nr:hypothetical protein [Dehalococcoidales bacterium]
MLLKTRLKLAIRAFKGKEFEMEILPYHFISGLSGTPPCDRSNRTQGSHAGCSNPAAACISRTMATMSIETRDHEHLCNRCANELMGKK